MIRYSITASLVFVLGARMVCGQSLPDPQVRHITVQGTGEVTVEPDLAEIRLGFFIRDRSHAQAKMAVDRKVDKLIDSLGKLGIPKADVRSEEMRISSKYTKGKGSSEFSDYCDLTLGLSIVVRDLKKLDQVLNAAVKAGINSVKSVQTHSSREAEIRTKAMQLAVLEGKRQASVLAGQLGITLGTLQSVTVRDTGTVNAFRATPSTDVPAPMFGRSGGAMPKPITVRSRVSITFQIRQ